MITGLKITNYALIEHLDVSFLDGMTCITGETGAGKSILMGGLSIVLGKRAELNVLKDSTKKCIVEASFLIDKYDLRHFFDEEALDYESETIIRREIVPSGKSRAFINDTPVTLDIISRLSETLIDVHSQHENQSLFKSEYQFLVLDSLAGNEYLLSQFQDKLKVYNDAKEEHQRLLDLSQKASSDRDYNRYLLEELEAANLKAGMQVPLEEMISQLSNIEDLQSYLSQSIQIIEEERMGVLTQLSSLKSILNQAAEKSKQFETFKNRTTSLSIDLKDMADDLQIKLELLEMNPRQLEESEDQLKLLYALFTKHKVDDVGALIEIKNSIDLKLQETENLEVNINKLQDKLNKNLTELDTIALKLHKNRQKAIAGLCSEMEQLVARMGMQNAKFKIKLIESEKFLHNGKERLEFLFSANLGSEYNPLKKVVSGGEMSRIMLSIKTILSRFKKLPTIVFDEIDTGVSGQVSNEIGNIMSDLAKYMQVFTITHLPQVAAKGKQHFRVYKEVNGQDTLTKLKDLNPQERVEELAQMLAGEGMTKTALEHAKQLLN